MDYFKSRTPREQALLVGMIALFALLAVWMVVIKPAMTMKTDAQRAQAAALRDYNIVRSGAPIIAGNSNTKAGAKAFDRSAIVSLAAQQSLPISRLQNEPGGAIKVWFEDVESVRVCAFLSNLSAGYSASIDGVQISRRDGETVSAQITVRGL